MTQPGWGGHTAQTRLSPSIIGRTHQVRTWEGGAPRQAPIRAAKRCTPTQGVAIPTNSAATPMTSR